jgi:hypothetical protein
MSQVEKPRRISFWAIVVAIMIGVFAALPWLWGIPKGADTLLHFYRTVQIDHMIEQGVLFSPWAPDMAYGFGYPIFNYYAPLSYYLASIFSLLGANLELAFQAIFVIAMVLSSVSMFLWTRDMVTEPAALVAAAMYALSPYILVDAVHRGALAELLALSMLPLILWTIRRYLVFGRWTYALVGILGFAALILSHNITALVFTPVLICYVFAVTISRFISPVTRVGFSWTRPVIAICLLILGLGLSAFFWVPALLERDLVQIMQVIGPSDFNYENNFLALLDLVALPFSADLNLVNHVVPISLSLVAIILGLIGIFSFKKYLDEPEKLAHLAFAGLVVAASLYLTQSLSTWVWESIPLLEFLQFPWRLLGLASLFLAFLSGVGAETLQQLARPPIVRVFVPAILVAVAILYILPWQFANYSQSPDESVFALAEFERESGYLGTTSTAEYLPIGVNNLPVDNSTDQANAGVKLQLDTLPPGATIEAAEYRPLAYDLIVNTPESFLAQFNTFYFDGWRAWVDDEPAPIVVSESDGLLGVRVPEGRHELRVQFGHTPVRFAARVITLVALLLVAMTIFVIRRRGRVGGPSDGSAPGPGSMVALLLIALVVVALTYVKLRYLDPGDNLLLNTRLAGETITDVDASLNASFEQQMILMGVDLPEDIIPGKAFDITLFWRAATSLDNDYSVSAVIVDQNGIILAQDDRQHPGVKPSSQWGLTDYAADTRRLTLPPGTPPGEYRLRIHVYEYGLPGNRLELLDASGMPAGQPADVVSFSVSRPAKPASLENIGNVQVDDIALWDDVSLVGYSLPDYVIRSGDAIFPAFYWQATGETRLDHKITIGLLADDGQLTELAKTRMIEGYPSFKWEEDDLWRVVQPLLLPPSLESGIYLFMVGAAEGVPVSLGIVEIEAPEHTLETPEFANPAGVRFDGVAELAGYDFSSTASLGETLEIILYWRSLGETQENYKTFVQLLDEEGRLVAGSDMVPGNWERPTTGWISGEYIAEGHLLAIPEDLAPGEYRLLVGMYDAGDLQRLETDDSQDSWFLTEPVEIAPR